MNKIKKIVLEIVVISFIFLFIVEIPVYAHYDRAYWHEESTTTQFTEQYRDWMITIPDYFKLDELSIPGTHDSMAFNSTLLFESISRTQTMSLEQQLLSGIRYLDIRVSHEGNYFKCRHGAIDLGYSFEDVLTEVSDFLAQYPTETIIMRFKQEYSSASDSDMVSLFSKYIEQFPDLFWNNYQSENPSNPKIGELRGKICLLSDVLSIKEGINYRIVDKQDNYYITNNWRIYDKWEAIKNQIIRSNTKKTNLLMMNYLSGSGGVFPYFVASGHINSGTYSSRMSTGLTEPAFKNSYIDFPRTQSLGTFSTISFEGINTLTADYIEKNKIEYTGIIVADFPGERLINEIIQCNYR